MKNRSLHKKSFTSYFLLTLIGVLTFFSFCNAQITKQEIENQECFMILVGKNATADGSVMAAHNLELSGSEISLIEKYPRIKHSADEKFQFSTGLSISELKETYAWMVLRIQRSLNSNAVAINEYGVALVGGLNLMSDRNPKAIEADPPALNGVDGLSRNLALLQAKTAREAVTVLGEMYTKYGNNYQCGVGYADTDEIWYIESGGGRSWAAVRIPNDEVWVQANSFRIGIIDTTDTQNVITSQGLLTFAKENGLWNPENGPFNFWKAFGGNSRGKRYNELREWRAMDMLSPFSKFNRDSSNFPMTFTPDKKVKLENLYKILRDNEKLGEILGRDGKIYEIKIGSNRIIHSDVIQLRKDMPVDVGAVMWSALSIPIGSIYIPFYFGIQKIPEAYNTGFPIDNSAHYVYKKLNNSLLASGSITNSTIKDIREFESSLLAGQSTIEKNILDIYYRDKNTSKGMLTDYVSRVSNEALNKVNKLLADYK